MKKIRTMISSIGHTCDGGNRTIRWSQFCDGIIDCYDRFDEEGHFCKHCINNLYSCPPGDPIRCDLACPMLHYVPCQTIQDRRACLNLRANYENYSPFHLVKDWNFYLAVAVATIVILLVLPGIVLLIKYLLRLYRGRQQQQRLVRRLRKSDNESTIPTAPPPPYLATPERNTLTSHIYEQCYEPPSYESAKKYPLTRTYYEHVV